MSRVYNRRGGVSYYAMLRVTTFTGFMTSVMIFTNVWFDSLLSVTRGDSDVLCRLQNIAGERILWTCGCRRSAMSSGVDRI